MIQAVGLLGALASGSLLEASDYSHSMRVNVPFSFVVAGQQFQAGEYDVRETTNGVITFQGAGKAIAVISSPLATPKWGEPAALRFSNTADREVVSVVLEGEGRRAVPVHNGQARKLDLTAGQ